MNSAAPAGSVLLAAFLLGGCFGNPAEDHAEAKSSDDATRVALDYARALDAGEASQCDLSVRGKADRQGCVAGLKDAPHAYVAAPESVGSYEWPNGSGIGRAVALKVTLKANPDEAQIQAFGLVQQDGQWLVEASGWTDGGSDAASTIGALS